MLPIGCNITSLGVTVKNVVYWNTPGEQYIHFPMVTHIVTMETGKYCSPGAFSYNTFFVSAPKCRDVVLGSYGARGMSLVARAQSKL